MATISVFKQNEVVDSAPQEAFGMEEPLWTRPGMKSPWIKSKRREIEKSWIAMKKRNMPVKPPQVFVHYEIPTTSQTVAAGAMLLTPEFDRPETRPAYQTTETGLVRPDGTISRARELGGVLVHCDVPAPGKKRVKQFKMPAFQRTEVTRESFDSVTTSQSSMAFELFEAPRPVKKAVFYKPRPYIAPTRGKLYVTRTSQKTRGREYVFPHAEPQPSFSLGAKSVCCGYDCFFPESRLAHTVFQNDVLETQMERSVVDESGVSGEANVSFVDDRGSRADSTHTTSDISTADGNNDMAESRWFIEKVLMREIMLYQGEWSSTDSTVVELPIFKCFTDVQTSMTVQQLKLFGFLRSGVRFRIQLNGTKFHCGRLLCYLVPPLWDFDKNAYPVLSCTAFPHVFLDASQSNTAELFAPFVSILSHFPQRAKSLENDSICTLGRLVIVAFNKLRFAEGASSELPITVYGQLVNPEVHQTTYPVEEFSYSDGLVTQAKAGEEGGLKQMARGAISTVGRLAGGLVTGGLNKVLDFVLDKPLAPLPAEPVVNRSINAPCHGAGLDHSVRLALSPVSQTETTIDLMGSTNPDFNLLTLAQIPTVQETVQWSGSDTKGKIMYQQLVSPVYLSPSRVTSSGISVAQYSPTMLAYVSRAFAYWRGDLKMKIAVVATQFHSGRLGIIYDPTWSATANDGTTGNVSLNEQMNHNMVVVDIQKSNEVEVDLPFMSVRPWLKCDRFRNEDNMKTDGDINTRTGETSCGIVRIFVIQPLVAPSNVSHEIDVNVFVYAGQNFELTIPISLSPLDVSRSAVVTYGADQEYPFLLEAKESPFFENREYIIATYFEGRRLFALKKISTAKGAKWYTAAPTGQWGKDEQTFTWVWKASQLARYTEKATSQQALLMNDMPAFDEEILFTQAGDDNTTRDNEMQAVVATAGNETTEVAPKTVSENAMNLQTVLKRAYPLYNSMPIYGIGGYTMFTIPVNPTYVPEFRQPIDDAFAVPSPVTNLAWFARLFTYWRGSLRYKFLFDGPVDAFCWFIPQEANGFNIMTGVKEFDIQQRMAYAGTLAATRLQASLEVEVPFSSPYNQCLIDVHRKVFDLRTQNGTLYLAFRTDPRSNVTPVTVSMFIAAGEDFVLNVLKAPPTVFEPQILFSACGNVGGRRITYPETRRDEGSNPDGIVVPGATGFKWLDPLGKMALCVPAPGVPTDDGLETEALLDYFVSPAAQDKMTKVLDNLVVTSETISAASSSTAVPAKLETTLDGINELTTNINNFVKPTPARQEIAKYTDISVQLILVFTAVQNFRALFTNPGATSILNFGMAFAALLGYNFSEALRHLLGKVAEFFTNYQLPRTQALDEAVTDLIETNEETLVPVLAVIATIIYAFLFDTLPSMNKIKSVVQGFFEEDIAETQAKGKSNQTIFQKWHFSVLGMKGISTVYEKMVEYIHRFLDWLLERENPQILVARKAGEYKDRLLKLIKDLDELDNEAVMVESLTNVDVHNRFYKMKDEANALMKICLEEKVDARLSLLIKETYNRTTRLIKALEKEQPVSTWRYDPFTIMFGGETGTGKTACMDYLAAELGDHMELPNYNRVYYRTLTADDFWNNYKNQPVVIWDEFAQSTKADKEVLGFMSLRGNAPTQVNMAAVEEKGRQFTSRLVLATSNVPFERFGKDIRCPKAYLRRRHVLVIAKFRPGHNVNEQQNSTGFDSDFDHIRYDVLNNIDDKKFIKRDLTLKELVEYIKAKLDRWNEKQENMRRDHENRGANIALPRGVIVSLEDEEREDDPEDEWEDAIFREDPDGPPLPTLDELADLPVTQAGECPCEKVVFRRNPEVELTEDEEFEVELFLEGTERMTCCEKSQYYRAKEFLQTTASKLYTKAKEYFETVVEKVTSWITENPKLAKLVGVLGVLSTGGLIYSQLGLKANFEGSYESNPRVCNRAKVIIENSYSNAPVAVGRRVTHVEGYEDSGKVVGKTRVITEGSCDPNAQAIRKRVHPYVMGVYWTKCASGKNGKLFAFQLGGTVLLLPAHFFLRAQEGDIFALGHRQNPVLIEYSKERMVRINNNDWVLYDCGGRLEPRKKNIQYFVSEKDLGKVKSAPCNMLSTMEDGTLYFQTGNASAVVNYKYMEAGGTEVYVQTGWRSNLTTEPGDCGSLLMLETTQISPPGKIVGIHVAGRVNSNIAFAVLVTREQLQKAWDILEERRTQVIGMPIIQALDKKKTVEDARIVPVGDYSLYGVLPNQLCPSQPAKSAFEKTPFHDTAATIVECPRKPAHLRPFEHNGERISPLSKALQKYGKQTKPFKLRNIKKVTEFVKNWTLELNQHQGKRIFGESEAVQGIPGSEHLKKMNLKSSAGWPYQIEERQTTGKYHLFDENGNVANSQLRQRLDKREELAKKGERVESLWRDCLKDELRPNDKVDSGKTRLFTIAPVDYTLLVRRYFMDFCGAFYAHNCQFYSAVGMTPESYDWTLMYNYLAEYGTRAIAGDFGTYDGTLMPELMEACGEIINAWYDDSLENQKVRTTLVNEMIHTMQLVDNCVYATHQGNPSGNPLTVIINSMVNVMYMLLVWLEIYPHRTCQDFVDNVRMVSYGDDNLLTVKPGNEDYNQNRISEVFAEHGIEYTTENKETSSEPYRELESVTFLKRGFRRDPEFGKHFLLPTMSLETLVSFWFYYRRAPDMCEQLQENMRAGLSFAAFHGKEYYDLYLAAWKKLMRQVNFQPLQISFEEQVDIFHGVVGMQTGTAEGSIDKMQKLASTKAMRVLNAALASPLYYLSASLGILATDRTTPVTDDRHAVAIPSGEGKSWLCKQFPEIFVDHDDLLIKHNSIKTVAKETIRGRFPWSADVARQYDFPKEDRRILLVHHPNNTNRQLLGSFITHYPTWIRINAVQRLRLNKPQKMTREERNAVLLSLAAEAEPQLFARSLPSPAGSNLPLLP